MGKEQKKDHDKIGRIADRPYWLTYVSLVARAVHQVGAAVFLAAYLLGVGDQTPVFYLIMATVSGFILMGVEAIRHRQLIREVSGLTTVIKLAIIGLAFHAFIPPAPAILFAFFMASLISHAPKAIRHRVVL